MVEQHIEVPHLPEFDELCVDDDMIACLWATDANDTCHRDLTIFPTPTNNNTLHENAPISGEEEGPVGTVTASRRKRRASSLVEHEFSELLRAALGSHRGPTPTTSHIPRDIDNEDVDFLFHGGGGGAHGFLPSHNLDTDPTTDFVFDTSRSSGHRVVPEMPRPDEEALVVRVPVVPRLQQHLSRMSDTDSSREDTISPDCVMASTTPSRSSKQSDSSPLLSARSPSSYSSSMSSPASRGSMSPSDESPSTSPSNKRRNNGASTNPELAAQRNHVCQLCDSRFLCKSKLERHMRTHTGAKPFGCYCGKAFNQKSALKNHSRRHIKRRDVPASMDHVNRGLNGFSYTALMNSKH